jgi:thiol-disulfide isomerase/thioredoxin
MNNRLLLALVVVAGLGGAAAYYVTTRPESATKVASDAAAPAGMDDATASTPPPQLAATIPAFQLADQDGVMRSLKDDWQGKALIVNFWATWCAPCRREIPLLKQLAADHAGENFQVIGIAVDFRDKVLAYAKDMQIDYPMLIGEQEALDAASACPSRSLPILAGA